jgi:hypothetical protein
LTRATLQEQIDLVERLKSEDSCPTYQDIINTLKFIAKPYVQEAIRLAHEAEKAKADPAVKNLMDQIPGQVILRHASE